MFAALAVAANRKTFFLWLAPRIRAALIMKPGLKLGGVVGEHRKRRHAVIAKVLELIVAPDDAEVRLEFIERAPCHAKALDHFLTMGVGMRQSVVRAPLLAHRRRPIFQRPQLLRQRRIREAHFDSPTKISLCREAGIMRHAQSEYLS